MWRSVEQNGHAAMTAHCAPVPVTEALHGHMPGCCWDSGVHTLCAAMLCLAVAFQQIQSLQQACKCLARSM